MKKVSLEMGGKNAVIVMDDADLNLAVEGILWSAFGTTGQRCTACSRVIVHKDVKNELEEKLVAALVNLTIGNGLDPEGESRTSYKSGSIRKNLSLRANRKK